MAKLILMSASRRRSNDPTPIPAIERYQGVFFRVIKKYIRDGRLKNTDIVIISWKFGVLHANEKVPYYPIEYKLNKEKILKIKETNLEKLAGIFKEKRYSEIFVVCGKKFQKLIEGFEKLTNAKIVFSQGAGLGPKAQSLKSWILDQR